MGVHSKGYAQEVRLTNKKPPDIDINMRHDSKSLGIRNGQSARSTVSSSTFFHGNFSNGKLAFHSNALLQSAFI